jgi:unsaturated rhamnogalacturonyl hydrolase
LIEALAKFQDPVTGRWYQVVDLPQNQQNWLETSCSAMFSYGTWWAYKHQLVAPSYAEVAKKGFAGVMQQVTKDGSDRTTIHQTCTGLNASDDLVGNYFNHPQADNDPHGIGAFLVMWEGMQ